MHGLNRGCKGWYVISQKKDYASNGNKTKPQRLCLGWGPCCVSQLRRNNAILKTSVEKYNMGWDQLLQDWKTSNNTSQYTHAILVNQNDHNGPNSLSNPTEMHIYVRTSLRYMYKCIFVTGFWFFSDLVTTQVCPQNSFIHNIVMNQPCHASTFTMLPKSVPVQITKAIILCLSREIKCPEDMHTVHW